MRIIDLVKMGLRNLMRRRARTLLTVIGVMIGTISIIVMVSIGIGMNNNFKKQIMEMGSLTTITVNKNAAIFDDKGNYISSKEQTMDDSLVETISKIKHVKVATPVITKYVQFTSGKFMGGGSIQAMSYEAFKAFEFPNLVLGEFPTEENKDVVIFGAQIVQWFYKMEGRRYEQKTLDLSKEKVIMNLENGEYKLQQGKKLKKIPLNNVALMEQSNNEYDYNVYMDLNTFKKYYREYIKCLTVEDRKKAEKSLISYDQIKINVDNIKYVDEVQEEIKNLGYSSESLGNFLKPMEQTSNMLQMVLGGIGAIAMLVSAINIANTMVMSIYERTKEIGIMKVLGCLVSDVKKLFLFEAGMIGLLGGIVGVILSYIASWAINKFGGPLFSQLMSMSYIADPQNAKFSVIPWWLPIAASAFAMMIGIISGYYPAKRATKISAIEAMKTES